MNIRDWDVWYSYSSYFLSDELDLSKIAESLVKSGLCLSVYSTDGEVWWNIDGQLRQSNIQIDRHGKKSVATITFPEKLEGYALEGTYQSAQMRFFEFLVFNDGYTSNYRYLRAFLGQCCLNIGTKQVVLYPQLKIYENGVLNVVFRMISPKNDYSLDEFVNTEVNLFIHEADDVLVPPEWVILTAQSLIYEKGFFERKKHKKYCDLLSNLVKKQTEQSTGEDFTFNLCSLGSISNVYPSQFDLDFIKEMVFQSVFHVTNLEKRKCEHHISDYWNGHPVVYLLEFDNQPETSLEMDKFKSEFGKILARTTSDSNNDYSKFVPNDLRSFDDYSCFITESISLWAFSKKGLKANQEFIDPNRGHLIYENQALIEAIIHLYMSYRKQNELASVVSISNDSLLIEKFKLLELESVLSKPSHFGEINSRFGFIRNEFKIDAILKETEEILRIRFAYEIEHRNDLVRKFGWVVSIMFGAFGTSTFASKCVFPIWKWSDLWLPCESELQEPFIVFITTSVAVTMLLFLKKSIKL